MASACKPTYANGRLFCRNNDGDLVVLELKLIKKGMIYSPAYGDMAFTVPLFDEFMIRAMPTFKH